MKKKILFSTALLVTITFFQAQSQINKGSIFLGGQINFYVQSTSSATTGHAEQTTNSIGIVPSIGKAIKDNLIVGVDLLYSHYNNQAPVAVDQNNNSFGAGVFMRRYISLGKNFYVFGQGRFGGSYNTSKTNLNVPVVSDDIKGFSFDLGFYPGISYQISKRLQLETGFNNLFDINFQHSKDIQTDTGSGTVIKSNTNTFSLLTSLNNLASFTLGFRVLLTK
ncbi:MAG TPA: outer membrane beta-barrel protein [Puia sp.]|nr:outer membrane beta-barrel protein [Puia sp.]